MKCAHGCRRECVILRRRALPALALFASLSCVSSAAGAAEKSDADKDVPARYRDGFTPSVSFHSGVGHASGYPNDAREIGNPDFFSSSDLLYGTTVSFHIGYALTDYLTFGFLVNLDHYESAHWREHGDGFGMRIDAFPLLTLYPKLHDLGLFLETGIGTASLNPKEGNYPSSDGTQTYLATGVFYELTIAQFRSSHFALAPEIKYAHIDSTSLLTDSASVGLRLAFYTSK
jgi:hypothetical protein